MRIRKDMPKNKKELLERLFAIASAPGDERRDMALGLAYLIVELVPNDRTTEHILMVLKELNTN